MSAIDDSEQPFALWVPRSYSHRKKYPLIVALHGSDAGHRMIPEECFQMHRRGFREDVIFLSPFGRGDIDYRGPGEADIWDTMNWVKSHYSIDSRRQYLTGLSMGGFTAWSLAAAYPDQWAAIAPVCGGGEVAQVKALKDVPVWCVHGERDELVPIRYSRVLVAELQRLGYPHRYDELKGWGHHSWPWLYDTDRKEDSLADWFLQFRRATPPAPILKPAAQGVFKDLFSERVIISYPTQTPIPAEIELVQNEAEHLARFSFGEDVMRTGKLIVKRDVDLSEADLASANLVFLGRTDNHHWLKQADRRLLARHVRGTLQVAGETYLGKSLVVAASQPSPWNKAWRLGIITYQQFRNLRGMIERFMTSRTELLHVNIYDTLQRRFIRQETGKLK